MTHLSRPLKMSVNGSPTITPTPNPKVDHTGSITHKGPQCQPLITIFLYDRAGAWCNYCVDCVFSEVVTVLGY